jgi:hypothetical protein
VYGGMTMMNGKRLRIFLLTAAMCSTGAAGATGFEMTGAGAAGTALAAAAAKPAAAKPAAAKPARSMAEIAYDFFRHKGLTKAQAAGIVGNLVQESSARPGAIQEGGPGRGIAQWSVGGRWDQSPKDNVTWYAHLHHGNPWQLKMQLGFIWYELTAFPGYGLKELRAARTVAAATKAFEAHYEVCGECNEPRRIAQAQVALREYGG